MANWEVPGVENLSTGHVNLQWEAQSKVAKLQVGNTSRYVKLREAFRYGLQWLDSQEGVSMEDSIWKWTNLLQGVGVAFGAKDTETVVLYRKPQHVRELTYVYHAGGQPKKAEMLIPETILGGTWDGDEFQDGYVFWVRKTAPQIEVSSWPWGNVYTEGKICWGSAIRPRILPQTIKQLEVSFWETPFNTDLLFDQNLKNWLREGEDLESQPYDLAAAPSILSAGLTIKPVIDFFS